MSADGRPTSQGDLTIGELARRAGVRTSALRYYEDVGVLPVARRVSGQRRYAPEALQRVAVVQVAQEAGFTLAEIRLLLHGSSARAVALGAVARARRAQASGHRRADRARPGHEARPRRGTPLWLPQARRLRTRRRANAPLEVGEGRAADAAPNRGGTAAPRRRASHAASDHCAAATPDRYAVGAARASAGVTGSVDSPPAELLTLVDTGVDDPADLWCRFTALWPEATPPAAARAALIASADPSLAVASCERLHADAPHALAALAADPATAGHLVSLLGASPLVLRLLLAEPGTRSLAFDPKATATPVHALVPAPAVESGAPFETLAHALRTLKRRRVLLIAVRDLLDLVPLEETTAELTALAEDALEAAVPSVRARARRRDFGDVVGRRTSDRLRACSAWASSAARAQLQLRHRPRLRLRARRGGERRRSARHALGARVLHAARRGCDARAPAGDRRRLRLPRRSAPAPRRGQRPARQFARQRAPLLRILGTDVGARRVPEGAPGRRRSGARRDACSPTSRRSSTGAISTTRRSRT